MPNPARWAAMAVATGALTTAVVGGPLSGTAHAVPDPGPSSLYAPSALVLTVAHGDDASAAAPERAVTLTCTPTASGTHPAAGRACAELRRAGGDFVALTVGDDSVCTLEYRPVVVTAQGVWQGKRVSYERTFLNRCVKDSLGTVVFAF